MLLFCWQLENANAEVEAKNALPLPETAPPLCSGVLPLFFFPFKGKDGEDFSRRCLFLLKEQEE